MPNELTDDLKVSNETPETIKARLLADTNAGVDPADPGYSDTAPGSFWDDNQNANVLELDRLYDRTNEAVGAGIPSLASGAALDEWATSLGLTRKNATAASGVVTFTGPEDTVIAPGTEVSTIQTSVESEPVSFQVVDGGTIDVSGVLALTVRAIDVGTPGNVAANTVTLLESPVDPDDATTLTNLAAITGGSDVETDEALSERVLRKLGGSAGGGNQDDYVNWALDTDGVGFVTVQPNTPDIGEVTVVITDPNNDPFSGTDVIDALKEKLDPSADAGQGAGLAPVGAVVHVTTPTATNVTVAATLVLTAGYSLDGAGGTQDISDAITASVGRYINGLRVGSDVIRTKVIAAIVDVVGVENVAPLSSLLLNGTAADLVIAADHAATMTTATWA